MRLYWSAKSSMQLESHFDGAAKSGISSSVTVETTAKDKSVMTAETTYSTCKCEDVNLKKRKQ